MRLGAQEGQRATESAGGRQVGPELPGHEVSLGREGTPGPRGKETCQERGHGLQRLDFLRSHLTWAHTERLGLGGLSSDLKN